MTTTAGGILAACIALTWVMTVAPEDYSDSVVLGLMLAGAAVCLTVGWRAPSPRLAFLAGMAAGAPAIAYSMLGHGLLEMGGALHTLAFGAVAAVVCKGAQRKSRVSRDPRVPASVGS